MNDKKLKVTEIQRFCMHDGPGVRTTVFLKGCPLNCEWCHNPETKKSSSELLLYLNKCLGCASCVTVCKRNAHSINDSHYIDRQKCVACGECATDCPTGAVEISGKDMSVDEIISVAKKDIAFYGKVGGVTLSGGEPLFYKDRAIELLSACKNTGLSTAVETCGYIDSEIIKKAVPFVDIFLWDIKDTDSERHKKYTGVNNELILSNLKLADDLGAKIRLRCILVNGVNTDDAHYESLAKIALSLKNLDGVEFIPYHAYGGTKATFIGGKDNGNKDYIPSKEQIYRAKAVLTNSGVKTL